MRPSTEKRDLGRSCLRGSRRQRKAAASIGTWLPPTSSRRSGGDADRDRDLRALGEVGVNAQHHSIRSPIRGYGTTPARLRRRSPFTPEERGTQDWPRVRTKAGQGSPLGAPHLRGGIGKAGCREPKPADRLRHRLRSMSLQAGELRKTRGQRVACGGLSGRVSIGAPPVRKPARRTRLVWNPVTEARAPPHRQTERDRMETE
jgi:hypothetical protein